MTSYRRLFWLDLLAPQPDSSVYGAGQLCPVEPFAVRLLSRQEAEQEDRVFWHSKTPAERLAAAEQLRQVAYGYDAATARIQPVIVRTRLKPRLSTLSWAATP